MNSKQEFIFSEAVEINPSRLLKKGTYASFVSMSSVEPNRRKPVKMIRKKYLGSGVKFKNGDTLLARITPCLEHGKTAFISNLKEEVGFGSTEFIVLCGKEGITDNLFVYYLCRYDKVRDFAIKSMTGTSGRQRVQVDAFNHLKIKIPPHPEQHRIAEILGSLDDKIELNYEMNKTLEAIAQAIFKNWFVDFEPFKDQLVYNEELGKEIPKEWEVVKIGEVVDIKKGLSYRSEGLSDESPVGLVNLKCIAPGGGFRNEVKPYSGEFEQDHVLQIGDIVVAITDLTQNREIIGMPARIPPLDEFKMLIASLDLVILRVKEKRLKQSFLYYLLLTHHYKGYVNGCADGTTVRHLKPVDILNYSFPLPPLEWQDKFATIADPIFSLLVQNFRESNILEKIRDALLPKLLSGEIRVKVDIEKEFPEETKKLEEIREEKVKLQESLEKWFK